MLRREEVLGKHFRKQLAACVRSIQWSYGIFWSLSTLQEGLLEWSAGFYNGDIKTRKTTQLTECIADEIGLQRSEQLRDLYESLSTGDINESNIMPSTSLSPEDLTDTEWYYVVCMSFTFKLGQDLPGKAYERREPVWLSNAQFAENKSFCRCLLAKSASIQTIVGLPFMDGVLEFGTSDLILEDLSFVQRITNSFWEFQVQPVSSENSSSSSALIGKEDNICLVQDHGVDNPFLLENNPLITDNDSIIFTFDVNSYSPNNHIELMHTNVTELDPGNSEKIFGTPEGISNVCDSLLRIKRLNEPWNVHTTLSMDKEFSNGVCGSLNPKGSVSLSFSENIISSPKGERANINTLNYLQEDNHTKFDSLDVNDDSHYARTISAILTNLKEQVLLPGIAFENGSDKTSFEIWKRGSMISKDFTITPQKMLKKILFNTKWMNGSHGVKSQEGDTHRNRTWKSDADGNVSHVLSERRRRVKLNEKFLILRSLVPSISKVDKASILADTIDYLKELERKVEELGSCNEETDTDMRVQKRYPDTAAQTSNNVGNNILKDYQISSTNKRKASDYEKEDENNRLLPKDGIVDINITIIEKEVLVEIQCPWRDFLLLDIFEGMKRLHLDAQSVQSSNVDGILAIMLRSKFMDKVTASPGMIKRTLQRVVSKFQAMLGDAVYSLNEEFLACGLLAAGKTEVAKLWQLNLNR